MQNSGMSLKADSEHFFRASNNNPIRVSMPYFGVIEEIWELDYSEFRVFVFKCFWVNMNTGMRQDDLGFTLVDLNMVAYKDEPFIMAEQAKQVFYVQDPSDSRLSVVLQGRKTCIIDQNDSSTLDICEISSFPTRMPSIIEEHEVHNVQANWNDHDEGLCENIPT